MSKTVTDGRFYEIDRAGCIVLGVVVLVALGATYALMSWLL